MMFADQLYYSLYKLHEPIAEEMARQWYYTAKMRDASRAFDDLNADLLTEIESLPIRLHMSSNVTIEEFKTTFYL